MPIDVSSTQRGRASGASSVAVSSATALRRRVGTFSLDTRGDDTEASRSDRARSFGHIRTAPAYTFPVSDFLVITGMSGAGRSQAADILEDLGWFVIDNLPPTLIPKVSEL